MKKIILLLSIHIIMITSDALAMLTIPRLVRVTKHTQKIHRRHKKQILHTGNPSQDVLIKEMQKQLHDKMRTIESRENGQEFVVPVRIKPWNIQAVGRHAGYLAWCNSLNPEVACRQATILMINYIAQQCEENSSHIEKKFGEIIRKDIYKGFIEQYNRQKSTE